jgi:hypothetical protein
MAYEKTTLQLLGVTAGADLSAKQYYAVNLTNATSVGLANVAGEEIHGVLQGVPTSGQAADVCCSGITKVAAGGTIAVGDKLCTDANGKFVAATSNNDYVLGICVVGAASGEIGSMVITHTGKGSLFTPSTIWTHQVLLASIADGDVVTSFVPGFAGKIVGFGVNVSAAVTTGSKATTLNLEIGTTNLTGGVLALTSANMTPLGKTLASTAITAANVFTATDAISIEASSTTAFVEGAVNIYVVMQ